MEDSTPKDRKDSVQNEASQNSGTSVPQTSGRALQRQRKLRFQPENVKFSKQVPRHQYYKEMLGQDDSGDVEIPRAICVADKVESSVKEMKAMLRAVSQHTSDRAVLQKIPRHMRRRAASHNRKRLPRRLHQLAVEMSQAQDAKPVGNPKRKKIRRKRDLQNIYAKRAGKQGWLETHLWHAKRFHMTETTDKKYSKWGNRVAIYPNDKSFRACYRAVAKHCLIQDISYMRCLQINSSRNGLLAVFDKTCHQKFTPTQLQGQEEANILLHSQMGDGSVGCIGPASVLWKPATDEHACEVLVWLHPVILQLALDAFHPFTKPEIANAASDAIAITNVSDELVRFRLTGPKSSITLLSVLRPITKLCETDGDSKPVLGEWMTENNDQVAQLHKDFFATVTECHRELFARNKDFGQSFHPDGSVYPVITDDPRLTLPLNKTTPTLTKLRKRLGCEVDKLEEFPTIETQSVREDNAEVVCLSPLWRNDIRDEVARSRKPDHIVSTRKRLQKFGDESVEDSTTWKESLSTPVPVIAIRKVPNEGWDLILPKKWGTAFWIPLIYNGARAGGLRENKNIDLEALKPHFPEDFPDTIAGKEWWDADANAHSTKYYRKPPAKRPNFSVLAIQSPFKPDWASLFQTVPPENTGLKRPLAEDDKILPIKKLKNDSPGTETDVSSTEMTLQSQENVQVVDGVLPSQSTKRPLAEESDEVPATKKQKIDSSDVEDDGNARSPVEMTSALQKNIHYFDNSESKQISVVRNTESISLINNWVRLRLMDRVEKSKISSERVECFGLSEMKSNLLCISVQALSKGVPLYPATISVPSEQDLEDFCCELTDPYKYGLKSIIGPEEKKHWDPYRKERKEARKLRRQQKKARKAKEKMVDSEVLSNAPEPPVNNKPMRFPVAPTRNVVGFVTSAHFLYSFACGAGVGFVSIEGLRNLVNAQTNHPEVGRVLKSVALDAGESVPLIGLVRNVGTARYRFVKINLIRPW